MASWGGWGCHQSCGVGCLPGLLTLPPLSPAGARRVCAPPIARGGARAGLRPREWRDHQPGVAAAWAPRAPGAAPQRGCNPPPVPSAAPPSPSQADGLELRLPFFFFFFFTPVFVQKSCSVDLYCHLFSNRCHMVMRCSSETGHLDPRPPLPVGPTACLLMQLKWRDAGAAGATAGAPTPCPLVLRVSLRTAGHPSPAPQVSGEPLPPDTVLCDAHTK